MARIMYDIAAGENLSSLLAQLNDKLAGFVANRAGQKSAYLDCDPGNWTGGERKAFDDDYALQQSQLKSYADVALRAKASVDSANQSYYTSARSGAPVQ